MIAALYVVPDGPYADVEGVDLWPESRDARTYSGPYPVVAHPPCQRWGRYWSGGPSAAVRRKLGDDGGCFKAALESVRTYGGVLEHPEASHAFKKFKMPIPPWGGGWTAPDNYGGRSACVSQGNYGHLARKMTWLYAVKTDYPDLAWGAPKNKVRLDLGYHSAEERRRAIKTGVCQRLSHRQRLLTPEPFRDLLINIARSVYTASSVHTGKQRRYKAQKETTNMKAQDHIAAHANGLKSSIHALEVQITILKGLIGVKTAAPAEESEEDQTDTGTTSDDTDDDFGSKPAKKAAKKAASFEEEEEESEPAEAEEEEEEDFTAPASKAAKPAKAAKAKKYTLDDANDACKAKVKSIGGKAGRDKVLAILRKNFNTESVSDLKPEQYAKCVELMAV